MIQLILKKFENCPSGATNEIDKPQVIVLEAFVFSEVKVLNLSHFDLRGFHVSILVMLVLTFVLILPVCILQKNVISMAFTTCRFFLKAVSFLFILAIYSNFSNAQTSCNEIKKMKITFEFSTPEEFTQKFYKLQDCGFDSIDCKIASTLAIMILFKKTEGEGKAETTYGEVINQLMKFKQNALYAQARNETNELTSKPTQNQPSPVIDYSSLCEVPIYKDTFDSFSNLPQYFSYDQALKCALSKGKLLFVYFTGHASASARKIEDDVLADSEIQKIITDNFIIVSLFVNHRGPIGKENLAFQERLGSLGQPAFYGINNQEKVIGHHIGYTNKETFLKFLHSLVEKN